MDDFAELCIFVFIVNKVVRYNVYRRGQVEGVYLAIKPQHRVDKQYLKTLFFLFKCLIDSHLHEHDGWHRFCNLNIVNLCKTSGMQIVSRQGSLAWSEMQRSKELMCAALHACGFGLPRVCYSAY